jgi:N-acetylmuramoyl-L-alanine amidase
MKLIRPGTSHAGRAVACLAAGGLALALMAAGSAASASVRHVRHVSAASGKLLAGKIIGIDPGHNGLNYTDPAYLNRQIWNGREWEDCDTTGTETASGYTEARFNWNVAMYLRAILVKDGAKVVLTRKNNHGLGPCVNTRARILDRAHANISIDIHADYGPASGSGFTVLEPVADGPNDKVITSSLRFGSDVHAAMRSRTEMQVSNYYGHDGYIRRDDLAGLNLTTMPKVLIECGNMNNARDAALLVRPAVQRSIARALAAAIVRFLTGHWPT